MKTKFHPLFDKIEREQQKHLDQFFQTLDKLFF